MKPLLIVVAIGMTLFGLFLTFHETYNLNEEATEVVEVRKEKEKQRKLNPVVTNQRSFHQPIETRTQDEVAEDRVLFMINKKELEKGPEFHYNSQIDKRKGDAGYTDLKKVPASK